MNRIGYYKKNTLTGNNMGFIVAGVEIKMAEQQYRELRFKYSDVGFVRNIYVKKGTKYYYCLQWNDGYNKPPTLYTTTKDGEPDCLVRKDLLEYFVFPEGHEHYGYMLRGL